MGGGSKRRIIVVQPSLKFNSLQPAKDAMTSIRNAARRLGLTRNVGINVRLTGAAPLEQEELESVAQGMGLAGLISFCVVVFLLFIGLRSARFVGAVLITLVMGLICTAALATLFVGRLNLISVAFAVLFIGLSVDFGIHYVLRLRENLGGKSLNARALVAAAEGVGGALTVCATAAAIGFFSFLPTSYDGLAELGLIAGIGMFVALVSNLTVLPACLALTLDSTYSLSRTNHLTIKLDVPWQVLHARSITSGALILAFISIFLIPHSRFDFDPLNLKDRSTESVQTLFELIGNEETAPYTADVLVKNLKDGRKIADQIRKLPTVKSVISIDRFVPGNQNEKLAAIEAAAFLVLPSLQHQDQMPITNSDRANAFINFSSVIEDTIRADKRADRDPYSPINRLLLLMKIQNLKSMNWGSFEQRLLKSLHGNLNFLRTLLSAKPIFVDSIPAEVRNRFVGSQGQVRLEIFPEEDVGDPEVLQRFVSDIRRVAPRATGTPVIIVEAGKAVIQAFTLAGTISLVAIGILVIVLLKRVRYLLLLFAPLILSALLTMSASAVFDLPFNFANVIVLPLLFGLGVASSIHFISRQNSVDNLRILLATSTPRAVLFSALTTIGSFASIALSSHPGTASMGVLLTIAISFTLLSTIVFLPALMAVVMSEDKSAK